MASRWRSRLNLSSPRKHNQICFHFFARGGSVWVVRSMVDEWDAVGGNSIEGSFDMKMKRNNGESSSQYEFRLELYSHIIYRANHWIAFSIRACGWRQVQSILNWRRFPYGAHRTSMFNRFHQIFPFVIDQHWHFTAAHFCKIMNASEFQQRSNAIEETHQQKPI